MHQKCDFKFELQWIADSCLLFIGSFEVELRFKITRMVLLFPVMKIFPLVRVLVVRSLLAVVAACAISIAPLSAAGLPAFVDGEPLPSLAPMLEQTTPAVVNISTTGSVRVANSLFEDPFFKHFFDLPGSAGRNPEGSSRGRQQQTQSLGSGVIVDASEGLVVTNHHVIEDADEILVTLNDGREFQATIVGNDPEADIAVIRIAAENLTALSWADSDKLRVGDFVVAIGNPFGLGQTVTSGIVSALGRSGLGIEEIEDFIQTDASINPGNSGGALVNLLGQLIGINTAIVGPSGGNVGIGFAIPSNLAQDLMQQLVRDGEVRRGKIGVSLQELTEDLQLVFGVKRGVVVAAVQPKSPAESAGLRRGDVLTEIDGRKVQSLSEVKNTIGLLNVGEQIKVKFIREKQSRTTDVFVGESELTSIKGEELADHLEGVIFQNFSVQGRSVVAIANVKAGSRMDGYGFRRGDIVLSVNRVPVENVEQMMDMVPLQSGHTVLDMQRGNQNQSVLVQ